MASEEGALVISNEEEEDEEAEEGSLSGAGEPATPRP